MSISKRLGVIIQKLVQARSDQKRIIAIIRCNPHVPIWSKISAISGEKGRVAAESNPPQNRHHRYIGRNCHYGDPVKVKGDQGKKKDSSGKSNCNETYEIHIDMVYESALSVQCLLGNRYPFQYSRSEPENSYYSGK